MIYPRLRRVFAASLIVLPALILLGWLIAAQFPIWTAPQPDWFAPDTPGVCAAVAALQTYNAVRAGDTPAVSSAEAVKRAAAVVERHYRQTAAAVSNPLLVRARFPDGERLAWLLTAQLERGAAVTYIDAQTGEPLALITALSPANDCILNVRRALIDAVKSPPFLLLAGYIVLLVVLFAANQVVRRVRRPRTAENRLRETR